ncbi:MAG TPA: cyclic nucleotide-binding domain-containing protein [Pyrinomonadaceae bacterium]|jgi:Fe-S-cluster-containing dehydrogenase component/CRP-like cAMP-binding protein|nr:cyclic nucleotide-binding domain-containing protein [Pyrinomonadaceae bacterium]
MPREITHHGQVIEAIRNSGVLSELLDTHDNHFKYELELELIVYGRTYADKRVGPYARLLEYEVGEEIIHEGDWGGNKFYILSRGCLDVYLKDNNGVNRRVGEIELQSSFGEMSVLAGQPRNATVVVRGPADATVLEIQRPALRLLRKLKKFGDRLEHNYRAHGLNHALVDIQEAAQNALSGELLEKLKAAARFTVYAKDHVLFREGDPLDKLVFINNGWVRRVRHIASDVKTARAMSSRLVIADAIIELDDDVGLDFLGAGNWLGLESLLDREQTSWKYAATVMLRTEALEISIAELRSNPSLVKEIVEYFPRVSAADDRPPAPADKRVVAAAAKEISTGIIDGTNLLVMDMDLCIRCGNCSLACHKVHGQSRLLRHGIHVARPLKPGRRSIQHVLSPSVCLHCQDPECLTGCPTGAIARFDQGQIDIDPQTCIGCADCATQCPYNAISMVPRKPAKTNGKGLRGRIESWLSLAMPKLPPEVTETADLLAVKCNLCANTPLNPAGAKTPAYSCQENCPTGALVRVNPREYFSEAKNAIGIIFKDQTHAIGRNIHRRDTPARVMHSIGLLTIIAIPSAILWAASRYTLDAHFQGTWLTLRWLTGLLGLTSISAAVTYSARKQIYRRRAGPLRYWKLAHVYLGILAGAVLLIHGGRDSGGLVTSMLMVSFDVVIVAGIFGALCYFIVPRIMTSIEGDPLLIEDLRIRRAELRETLALIDTANPELRNLVKSKVRKRFFSLRYLLRQYIKREELTRVLADAREEFRTDAQALSDAKDRRSLIEAVEATVTLRRVDSLIYLHQLLKLWLAPHVVAASLMLTLMCVHIIQVTLFTVR